MYNLYSQSECHCNEEKKWNCSTNQFTQPETLRLCLCTQVTGILNRRRDLRVKETVWQCGLHSPWSRRTSDSIFRTHKWTLWIHKTQGIFLTRKTMVYRVQIPSQLPFSVCNTVDTPLHQIWVSWTLQKDVPLIT
jgi:hypothetical protein